MGTKSISCSALETWKLAPRGSCLSTQYARSHHRLFRVSAFAEQPLALFFSNFGCIMRLNTQARLSLNIWLFFCLHDREVWHQITCAGSCHQQLSSQFCVFQFVLNEVCQPRPTAIRSAMSPNGNNAELRVTIRSLRHVRGRGKREKRIHGGYEIRYAE